ncbi:isoprenoid synthase domain-containing protein [Podospora australis]|uniref:Terpene synthase n=1 Tax=Podospora australis TaxID=1536484 RepID=A0AAN7ANB8_9PEZI|nr:isoprenoid synthase domain-containing protein [Podospora australis]
MAVTASTKHSSFSITSCLRSSSSSSNPPSPSFSVLSPSAITSLLKQTTLHIPDLTPLFRRWPSALSPHYPGLARNFDKTLDKLFSSSPNVSPARAAVVRQKMAEINIPLFASLWWPSSSLPKLEAMAEYTLWLFLWDDDLDGANSAPESEDTPPASPTRQSGHGSDQSELEELSQRVLEYAKHHLGVSVDTDTTAEEAPTEVTKIARAPLNALRESGNWGMVKRLMGELEFYMECCGTEQKYLNTRIPAAHTEGREREEEEKLPGVQEYWDCRMGTSAVGTYAALTEYMIGVELPNEIFEMLEMKTMWFEVNRNISYINDTISLKKELNSSLHSLIPVTMTETGQEPQDIINGFVLALQTSAENFDRAAESLMAEVANKKQYTDRVRLDVQEYIDGLRFMMTGSFYWSLASDRYDVARYIQENRSLVIPLMT